LTIVVWLVCRRPKIPLRYIDGMASALKAAIFAEPRVDVGLQLKA
jgi:hypothetical protein